MLPLPKIIWRIFLVKNIPQNGSLVSGCSLFKKCGKIIHSYPTYLIVLKTSRWSWAASSVNNRNGPTPFSFVRSVHACPFHSPWTKLFWCFFFCIGINYIYFPSIMTKFLWLIQSFSVEQWAFTWLAQGYITSAPGEARTLNFTITRRVTLGKFKSYLCAIRQNNLCGMHIPNVCFQGNFAVWRHLKRPRATIVSCKYFPCCSLGTILWRENSAPRGRKLFPLIVVFE